MRMTVVLLGLASTSALAQEPPREFVRAPALELAADDGRIVRLEAMEGSIVLLYFFRYG